MANVENPYNTTLQNSLVVTSHIEEEAYYSIRVKYFNRSDLSVTMPGDYTVAEATSLTLNIPQIENLTSFYTTNSVEGNESSNPDDYEGLIQSTQINITLTEDTVINVLYFYSEYITVQFVSEDPTRGLVIGEVNQQIPLIDGIAKITSVPSVGGIGRYRFDHWTDEQGISYATADDIRAATFSSDKTFTAHFRYISSSGGLEV